MGMETYASNGSRRPFVIDLAEEHEGLSGAAEDREGREDREDREGREDREDREDREGREGREDGEDMKYADTLEDMGDADWEGTSTRRTQYELIGDLVHDGDSVVVAYGGAGGRGNVGMGRYRQDHRSDHELGEFVRLELEMKMISDLSLVGFPNVGKSSLLRRLSSAAPKVGSYAFTTMTPQLGSVLVGGSWDRFVVADVPGLIQGAHVDRGVGHTFLRHVERANAIVIVLDAGGAYALDGCKSPLPPEEQLERLRGELGHFSGELLDKRWMVVLNKMDLVKRREAFVFKFRAWLADRYGEVPVVSVSALAPETRSVDSIATLARAMKDMIRNV